MSIIRSHHFPLGVYMVNQTYAKQVELIFYTDRSIDILHAQFVGFIKQNKYGTLVRLTELAVSLLFNSWFHKIFLAIPQVTKQLC